MQRPHEIRSFGLVLAARVVVLALAGAVSLAGARPDAPSTEPRGPDLRRGPSRVAERVVSMNPSLTAMLIALGATDSIVGVDDYSARQQPAVAHLPTVGGLFDPSLEAVVALRPDLVALVPSVEQRDFRRRLDDLGIETLVLESIRFESVLASIETLGARVGRPQAADARIAAIAEVRGRIERAAASRPQLRALVVLQRNPLYVVGGGSFIDEMIRAVGAENVAEDLGGPYPRVSIEWVIEAAPEVIVDAARDAASAHSFWSRWPSLPAVREERVQEAPEGVVTLPGPYLDRALATLALLVHGPELLADAGVELDAGEDAAAGVPAARRIGGNGR